MTTVPVPNRLAVPVTLAGQQASTRTATLEQLRELEGVFHRTQYLSVALR